jgi:hypothetical protein
MITAKNPMTFCIEGLSVAMDIGPFLGLPAWTRDKGEWPGNYEQQPMGK